MSIAEAVDQYLTDSYNAACRQWPMTATKVSLSLYLSANRRHVRRNLRSGLIVQLADGSLRWAREVGA